MTTRVIQIWNKDQLEQLPSGTLLHVGPLDEGDRRRWLERDGHGLVMVVDENGGHDYDGTVFDELWAFVGVIVTEEQVKE